MDHLAPNNSSLEASIRIYGPTRTTTLWNGTMTVIIHCRRERQELHLKIRPIDIEIYLKTTT